MLQALHQASQYLAAAGISLLPNESDDSHTNLGWSIETASLTSRPLSTAGDCLALNLKAFALEWWRQGQLVAHFPLTGKNHPETLNWLIQKSREAQLEKEYAFELHYELPYPEMTAETLHPAQEDRYSSESVIQGFTRAKECLQQLLDRESLSSELRVWPHHFDLGAFATVIPEKQVAVGIGYAMPDSMIDEHYFYMSAWQANKAISTMGFPKLSAGFWCDNPFSGAILRASGQNPDSVEAFLAEAIHRFKEAMA